MKSYQWVVNRIRAQSEGNVESSLTLLPMVGIFLLCLQLIFMQMSRSTQAYLFQGGIGTAAIKTSSTIGDFSRVKLIGGGIIIIAEQETKQPAFSNFLNKSDSYSFGLAIDESSIS
jgi:hypothetical protein